MRRWLSYFALIASSLLASVSCESFDPPPDADISNEVQGIMDQSPSDPIIVTFSEPIVPDTLRVKIVFAEPKVDLDPEENLLDEQDPPDVEKFRERTVIAYDAARPSDESVSYGAEFELSSDNRTLTIAQPFTYPVSTPYMLLIEPGLRDTDGNETVPRIRIPFTFQLTGGGPTTLPGGYYFFLMNVEPPPISQQLRLYAHFQVDPNTGLWEAIFTDAQRLETLNSRPGCPDCSGEKRDNVCRLFPAPDCVAPSQNLGDVTEFPDRLPVPEKPGFTFVGNGFAADEADGSWVIGTPPFDIDINVGSGGVNVLAKAAVVTARFRESETIPGRLEASGSLAVEVVKLNGVGEDPTQGTVSAISLSDDEVAEVESFGTPIPTL